MFLERLKTENEQINVKYTLLKKKKYKKKGARSLSEFFNLGTKILWKSQVDWLITKFNDNRIGASVSNKIDEVVSRLMNCNVYNKAIGNDAYNERIQSDDNEGLT